VGGSSERFGTDQDIQSKFIKKSAFHIIIEADVMKYLALHSAKKCQWQGAGQGMGFVQWCFTSGSKGIED